MTILTRLYRYGDKINSHDLIKVLATFTMFIDHIGLYLEGNNTWWRIIGRTAAPLFFFLVGYVNKYRFRFDLVIYGLLLTGITFLLEHSFYLNILISFALIKWLLDRIEITSLSTFNIILIFLILSVMNKIASPFLEYGTLGILFASSGKLMAENDARSPYYLIATVIIYFIYETINFNFLSSLNYLYSFLVVCLFLYLIMLFYRFKYWNIWKYFKLPILFISRYSLQIYFIHLAILKIYNFWIYRSLLKL